MFTTVLSMVVLMSIIKDEGGLFSLNVNDSYPDLIISEIRSVHNSDSTVNFEDMLSFLGVLPKEEFGEIRYTTVVKTRMNVNSGNTRSNIDIYGIEQEGLASIVPALKNVQSIDDVDALENKYSIIDSMNASPREIIVGSTLAKSLGVGPHDELIISTTGDRFWYYAEVFSIKFVLDSGNKDFDNSILMSRDYIDSIANADDVSLMYFSMGNKDKSDQLKNILLENYSEHFEILSSNDYVNGYNLYNDIFAMIPTLYALLFFTMLFFFYSINIKSRHSSIEMISSKLKSKPFVLIVSIVEVLMSALFFIATLPIVEMTLKTMEHSAYSLYRVSLAVISIIAIVVITAISYLLSFFKNKEVL